MSFASSYVPPPSPLPSPGHEVFFRRTDSIKLEDTVYLLGHNPGLLAYYRARFTRSPPSYRSSVAVDNHVPYWLMTTNEKAVERRRERREHYELSCHRSRPDLQFEFSVGLEAFRIHDQAARSHERRKYTLPFDDKLSVYEAAENNVRRYWKEQGIWNEAWDGPLGIKADNKWMHEESTNSPSVLSHLAPRSDTPQAYDSLQATVATEQKPTTVKRDTSASRPYQQFLYQMCKEREWIEDDNMVDSSMIDFNVDALAYEEVKKRWIRFSCWNPRWIHMPGATWIHEDPDEYDSEVSSASDTAEKEKAYVYTNQPVSDQLNQKHANASESLKAAQPELPEPGPTGPSKVPAASLGTSRDGMFRGYQGVETWRRLTSANKRRREYRSESSDNSSNHSTDSPDTLKRKAEKYFRKLRERPPNPYFSPRPPVPPPSIAPPFTAPPIFIPLLRRSQRIKDLKIKAAENVSDVAPDKRKLDRPKSTTSKKAKREKSLPQKTTAVKKSRARSKKVLR